MPSAWPKAPRQTALRTRIRPNTVYKPDWFSYRLQRTCSSGLAAVVFASLLLAGCGGKTLQPEEQSGYLKDYSGLTEAEDPKGNPLFRYVSPKLNPNNYSAVIVEPLEFDPKPEPTVQVSDETLRQLGAYLNQSLHVAIGAKVRLVDAPAPAVARLNVAITAAAPQKEGLAAYQYIIPFAFIFAMTKRAISGQAEQARLMVETWMTDSVSGETLLKSVRVGEGETLKKVDGVHTLTLEDVKPLIDEWAAGVSAGATVFIRAR